MLLVIVSWGMASHSSRRTALRSFWGTALRASTRQLRWSHRFSMGFRSGDSAGHSIEVPQSIAAMSWSIVVHEDEIRPVLFIQEHNDRINDVIQVVCGCHFTIHKVLGSSVLTRHTCPNCNTTTTKARLVTTVADASHSPWRFRHRWWP